MSNECLLHELTRNLKQNTSFEWSTLKERRKKKKKKGNEDEKKRVFVPVSSSVQTNLASNCGREERKSQKNVTPVVLDDFF